MSNVRTIQPEYKSTLPRRSTSITCPPSSARGPPSKLIKKESGSLEQASLLYTAMGGEGKKDRIYAATVNHGLRRRRSKAILLPLRICQKQKATKNRRKGDAGKKGENSPDSFLAIPPFARNIFRVGGGRDVGMQEGERGICAPLIGGPLLFSSLKRGFISVSPTFNTILLFISLPPHPPQGKRGGKKIFLKRELGEKKEEELSTKKFSLFPQKKSFEELVPLFIISIPVTRSMRMCRTVLYS